jgi:hypothetical protein
MLTSLWTSILELGHVNILKKFENFVKKTIGFGEIFRKASRFLSLAIRITKTGSILGMGIFHTMAHGKC